MVANVDSLKIRPLDRWKSRGSGRTVTRRPFNFGENATMILGSHQPASQCVQAAPPSPADVPAPELPVHSPQADSNLSHPFTHIPLGVNCRRHKRVAMHKRAGSGRRTQLRSFTLNLSLPALVEALQPSPPPKLASPLVGSPEAPPSSGFASPLIQPQQLIGSLEAPPSSRLASPLVQPQQLIESLEALPSSRLASPLVQTQQLVGSPEAPPSSRFVSPLDQPQQLGDSAALGSALRSSFQPFFMSGSTPIEGVPEWMPSHRATPAASDSSIGNESRLSSDTTPSAPFTFTPVEGVPERMTRHKVQRPAASPEIQSVAKPKTPLFWATPSEGCPEKCCPISKSKTPAASAQKAAAAPKPQSVAKAKTPPYWATPSEGCPEKCYPVSKAKTPLAPPEPQSVARAKTPPFWATPSEGCPEKCHPMSKAKTPFAAWASVQASPENSAVFTSTRKHRLEILAGARNAAQNEMVVESDAGVAELDAAVCPRHLALTPAGRHAHASTSPMGNTPAGEALVAAEVNAEDAMEEQAGLALDPGHNDELPPFDECNDDSEDFQGDPVGGFSDASDDDQPPMQEDDQEAACYQLEMDCRHEDDFGDEDADENAGPADEAGPCHDADDAGGADEDATKQKKPKGVGGERLRKLFSKRKSLAGNGLITDLGGIRHSSRNHGRPLEFWRNEHKVYGRAHKSLPTVVGICTLSPDPEWPAPGHKEAPKNAAGPNAKGRARARTK